MSYRPKKGMHNNDQGVAVFDDPGTAVQPGGGKRWWVGTVVRKVFNSRNEMIRKSKQTARVFAKEADVVAMVCRQCSEASVISEGELRTSVTYSPA